LLAKKRRNRRWAAAAVELAVVTPFLLMMLFGIVEFGWIFTVRQGLVTAAREGARTAALPGATETDVANRVAEFLTALGVTGYTYSLTSDPVTETETVTVNVPYSQVTLVGGWFDLSDFNLGATCSMRKEGVD
jgi:Flp pilus assembly protein TadG